MEKNMRTFFKVLFWIFFGLILLISIHSIFNGGIENMIEITKNDGFFEFLKQYFMEIWNGIRALFGM